MYPLLMEPYFRHGEMTPWGGHKLHDWLNKNTPDDNVGESLEVSAFPGLESTIINGEFAGKTLKEIYDEYGSKLTGGEYSEFPLQLKLLDANDMLSVQVHPDDDYSKANEGKLGKTEAWLILACEPGAKIVFGLETNGQDLKEIVEAGKLESVMRWVSVKPGDVLYIPHGTVHALGGGVLVYEIQQSSDVTYRFYDWGRVGKDGKPRALHTEKALAVSRPQLKGKSNEGTTVITEGGSQTYFVADERFELSRLNPSGNMPIPGGRMSFLTPVSQMKVMWENNELTVNPFQTVVIPACLEGVTVSSDDKIIMSRTPDREYLRNLLNYRAENVDGLVD